jgi:hypothetical protein
MMEAGLEPLEPYKSIKTPWLCKCLVCGREVTPTFANVRNGHKGCAYCARKKTDVGNAIKIMETRGVRPTTAFPGAKKPWRGICLQCGEEVEPRFADILNGQGGCKYCAYRKKGFAQRIEEHKAIQMFLDVGLQPLEKYQTVETPWKSLCLNCHNVVSPRLHAIQSGQRGCRYCGRLTAASKNRIRQDEAKKVMIEAGYTPLEPYVDATSKWKCTHNKCGEIVEVRYSQVNFGLGGCRKCGYEMAASKQRKNEQDAIQLMLDAGLQPIEKYESANKKWKCIHIQCGKEVTPKLGHIQAGRGGCKYCGIGGINYNEPAYVYLIENVDLGSVKIGITNSNSVTDRIKAHQENGWRLIKKIELETGQLAWSIEQEVLKWWRKTLKLPVHLSPDFMPQGGWTETVDSQEIDLVKVWERVEKLAKFDS